MAAQIHLVDPHSHAFAFKDSMGDARMTQGWLECHIVALSVQAACCLLVCLLSCCVLQEGGLLKISAKRLPQETEAGFIIAEPTRVAAGRCNMPQRCIS